MIKINTAAQYTNGNLTNMRFNKHKSFSMTLCSNFPMLNFSQKVYLTINL